MATRAQVLAELDALTVALRAGVREMARKLRAVEQLVFGNGGGRRG